MYWEINAWLCLLLALINQILFMPGPGTAYLLTFNLFILFASAGVKFPNILCISGFWLVAYHVFFQQNI